MTIRTHTCITVACDICKYAFDEDEYTVHFDNVAEARKILHSNGWLITTDERAFCASGDAEHQAAHDALMPPAPMLVPEGQLDLDCGEQR